jgi:hypothetical protein
MTEQKRDKLALPLRIDTDAFVVTNIGIVFDANNELVAEYETIDEAEAFVADANGVDVTTLRRQMEESARMRHEYLRRLKQDRKPTGI